MRKRGQGLIIPFMGGLGNQLFQYAIGLQLSTELNTMLKLDLSDYEKQDNIRSYKLDVFNNNGDYITSIGSSDHMDYPTYINYHGWKYADKRRQLYKLRHSKDRDITWSRGFFTDRILW